MAQVLIDDFSDDQGPITLTSPGTTNDATTGSMLGGEREIFMEYLGGEPSSFTVQVTQGEYRHGQDPGVTGISTITWDGDGDAGAQGVSSGGFTTRQDFTAGGQDAFKLFLVSADQDAVLDIEIFSGSPDCTTDSSSTSVTLTEGANNEPLIIPYSDFSGNVDFTDVCAVQVTVDGSSTASLDVIIDLTENTTLPDLTATKTNSTGGDAAIGETFQWSIEVANASGSEDAVFDFTDVMLTDDLPSGPTYSNVTVNTGSTTTTDGGEISCGISSNTLSCSVADPGGSPFGTVAIPGGGSFTVSFDVTPQSTGTIDNPPGPDGVCEANPNATSDPGESDMTNNACSNQVTVDSPDLTADKVNDVNGATSIGTTFTWTTTVENAGAADASYADGEEIFQDDLPSGPNYTNLTVNDGGLTAGGVSCSLASNTITCTASGATTIAPTESFSVAIDVTSNSPGTLSNPRSGGICEADANDLVPESDEGNNSCSDDVTIQAADLIAEKTNDTGGSTPLGTPFQWRITVTNDGVADADFTDGTEMLRDDLPSDADYTNASVSVSVTSGNVVCALATNQLSCDADGATTMATNDSFTVTFDVEPTAPGDLVNPTGGVCEADPTDALEESDNGNNSCSDTVSVEAPDMTATKANDASGSFQSGGSASVGVTFQWRITVSNDGSADADFADGVRLLVDELPSSPTYANVAVDNSGISGSAACEITSNALTCRADGAVTMIPNDAFVVTFDVTPTIFQDLDNPRAGGVCETDPDDVAEEQNETNNACSDSLSVSASDLQATKMNDASGGVVDVGQTFNWTIELGNAGSSPAQFPNDAIILRDDLPGSATYAQPTLANANNIAGTIDCSIDTGSTLTCLADGAVTFNGTASVDVVIEASPVMFGTATNPRATGVCEIDPANTVVESTEDNNSCSDTLEFDAIVALEVSKALRVSQQDPILHYTITITNVGGKDQTDNPGNEFEDTLPEFTQLVAHTMRANRGDLSFNEASNTLVWNGVIPSEQTLEIEFTVESQQGIVLGNALPTGIWGAVWALALVGLIVLARRQRRAMSTLLVLLALGVSLVGCTSAVDNPFGFDSEICNQGFVHFDPDTDGTNNATRPTDDPSTPEPNDPTCILFLPGASFDDP